MAVDHVQNDCCRSCRVRRNPSCSRQGLACSSLSLIVRTTKQCVSALQNSTGRKRKAPASGTSLFEAANVPVISRRVTRPYYLPYRTCLPRHNGHGQPCCYAASTYRHRTCELLQSLCELLLRSFRFNKRQDGPVSSTNKDLRPAAFRASIRVTVRRVLRSSASGICATMESWRGEMDSDSRVAGRQQFELILATCHSGSVPDRTSRTPMLSTVRLPFRCPARN
jgi:hypothetical protein